MSDLKKMFENPSAQYRGKPFWSWNGELKKDELIRQIRIMKEMGFGGYFMHSRTGLKTEYLGEEWFELINDCADEGTALGMEAWLYDEDRWPSGSAGGMVTKNPKNRMKYLVMDKVDGCNFKWNKNYLAAFECDLEGISYKNCVRVYNTNDSIKGCKDKTIIAFRVEEMAGNTFYNGYTYLDTINKEAVEAFIESTHEKYKEKCGNRFGKEIKGIFTDEPHRGGLFTLFNDTGKNAVVWTYDLFEQFEKRFGYDLVDNLPDLFLCKNGEKVSKVKWNFIELLQQLFIERFAIPINEWCIKNNIILTGHVLHEDSFSCQTAMHGSLMRFYEHMGYPGVDVLTEGNKNYWIVKQVDSASRQTGKKWILSELYGCTGWQFTFEGHKNVGDWQALFGVNIRCHHLSWYTMEGEAKRDYPASILHQSGWWKDYKYVEDYFSRINVIMSRGNAECNLLVINPVESVWSRVYSGCFERLTAVDEDILRLEHQYAQLFGWLMGERIDFDYGDEEMVSRLAGVITTEDKPVFKVGEVQYKKILIGGMDTVRSTVLALLKEFANMGGEVIFAGDAPAYVDAQKSQEALIFAQSTKHIPWDCEAVTTECMDDCVIRVLDCNGKNIPDIFARTRNDGQKKYVMLLNTNRQTSFEDITINLGLGGYAEQWDATSGTVKGIDYTVQENKIIVNSNMFAGEERIYVIASEGDAIPRRKTEVEKTVLLPNEYQYSLNEPNICVLDYASVKIDGGDWQAFQEILKVERYVRGEFGLPVRQGKMVQPWYAKKENKSNLKSYKDIELKFVFYVDDIPNGEIEIVMENFHAFEVEINGDFVDTSKPKGKWIDICFDRFELPNSSLRNGYNEIILKTQYNENIEFEALYILGEFGVNISGNKKMLTLLPSKLKTGDISEQGLPFYSGSIKYHVCDEKLAKKQCMLRLGKFGGACVKAVKGDNVEMIAWQPYHADISHLVSFEGAFDIELVLTRRNTFGPLHMVPAVSKAYGPMHFTTEGEEFSENYMLIEQGLLCTPKIDILKEVQRATKRN